MTEQQKQAIIESGKQYFRSIIIRGVWRVKQKVIGNALRSLFFLLSITFRCNMWMLLIVKLLSFKRYNYPFYKCRESGRQMQCAYSQPVSDKVVPLLFSLFCKILETNAMHCFSASSVSCVTERLSVAKIQIYIGLEQTIILKNIIPQLFFSIILIAPLYVSQSMSCRQWAM